MAPRESPLFQFMMEALMDQKYPNLNWINRKEGIFCLDCTMKSKKAWNPLFSKIFDDYHKLKVRKSNEKRQRFLVAMKACPLIKHLEEMSSKEKKFYQFMQNRPSFDETSDEIEARIASMLGVGMDPFSPIDDESGANVGDNEYETPGVSGRSEVTQSYEIMNNSDEDLMMDVVPDARESYLQSLENEASMSFFNDSIMTTSDSYNHVNQDSSSSSNLAKEEWSYSFSVNPDDDFPSDYDPEKDLIQSVTSPKSANITCSLSPPTANYDQIASVLMPSSSNEPPNCEIPGVFKLSENDGIVKRLQQNNVSKDNCGKDYFMMVLKPKQI